LREVTRAAVVSEGSFGKHQLLERSGKPRNAAVDAAETLSRVGVVPRQEFPHDWEESEPIDDDLIDRLSQSCQLLLAVIACGYVLGGGVTAAWAPTFEVRRAVAASAHAREFVERSAECPDVVVDVTPASEQPVKVHSLFGQF
jgi:hypothetical protein